LDNEMLSFIILIVLYLLGGIIGVVAHRWTFFLLLAGVPKILPYSRSVSFFAGGGLVVKILASYQPS